MPNRPSNFDGASVACVCQLWKAIEVDMLKDKNSLMKLNDDKIKQKVLI